MTMTLATTNTAVEALALVQRLQKRLVQRLSKLPPESSTARFVPVDWLRAKGSFGGGTRFSASDPAVFNRASVNISQVQYEKDPSKKLGSATAISTIVHPANPHAPSMHMHISWTVMKSGAGYWRIMGDLNPSIVVDSDREAIEAAFRTAVGPKLYDYGTEQGGRYFYIPALGRHRGVAHFYLEEFSTQDFAADFALAERFGQTLIDAYAAIVDRILRNPAPISTSDRRQQLDYHSLYFLQVLTLDRGTTSGLLVHDENDVGILGSLPSHVDKKLLGSWVPRLPTVQQELLSSLVQALPGGEPSHVDNAVKARIATVIREFYKRHPAAEELLARGDRLPPTQQNHQ